MSPRDPANRCLKLAEWPLPDQAAWAAALQPGDAAGHADIATRWSEATRRMVKGGYGMWLTWLGTRGLLNAATPPAARVTAERVALYRADLQRRVAAFTVAARIEQLGNAMRVLAPEGQWHWLQRIADQVRSDARKQRAQAQVPQSVSCRQEDSDPAVTTSPETAANRCLPLAEWPAADQAAWAAALQPGDVLEPGGVAARWAVTTQGLMCNGYGRWLTWLRSQGALDPTVPPATRVTRERLLAYTRNLQATVAPFTVAARIEQVGNALRALAPDTDWRWIQRAADRLRAKATSVRDKRARLQPPDDLVAFGAALMAKADDPASGSPAVRAAAYRDGLLIGLLARRPMRRANVTAILCGQHLVRRGTTWWLEFPTSKTRQPLEFPFPADLVPALHHYLEVHRPVLLARGDRHTATRVTALWVSKNGTRMGGAAIFRQVSDRTAAAFGRPMNPHLFRDALATGIAINAPDDLHMIPSLLGHSTPVTSERHYNLAGSLEAGRRYAATIAALRDANPHEEPA